MFDNVIKNLYLDPIPTRESMDEWHKEHSDPSVRQSNLPDYLWYGIYGLIAIGLIIGQAYRAFGGL